MNTQELEQLKKITTIEELQAYVMHKEDELLFKQLKTTCVVPVTLKTRQGDVEVNGIEFLKGWALITEYKKKDITPSITHIKSGLALRHTATNKKAKQLALHIKKNLGAELMAIVEHNASTGGRIYNNMNEEQKELVRGLREFY